jgi:two-component system, OmpR family, response regulator
MAILPPIVGAASIAEDPPRATSVARPGVGLLSETAQPDDPAVRGCGGAPGKNRPSVASATSKGRRAPRASREARRDFMKTLLIEDDGETAAYIVNGLTEEGLVVDHARTGRDGLVLAAGESYDVMIVDRMLPGLDGLAIVKTIRGAGVKTPVLFLTTMSGVDDRVEGLEAGGDDYLVKPFAFSELLARLHALARRPPLTAKETTLTVADLEMDLIRRKVTRGGQTIELQPREFRLLEYLMRNSGRIVTRTMLLEQVWEFHFDPKTNVVETQISRLRAKVDKPFDIDLIHTVRGAGYRLYAPR